MMNTYLTRTSLGLLLLGASMTALAFAPARTESNFNVTVPNQNTGWYVNFSNNYLTPTINTNYASVGTINSKNFITGGSTQAIDPSFHYGFSVNVGYLFADSGMDVGLGFEHYKSDDSDSITAGSGQGVLPLLDWPFTPPGSSSSGSSTSQDQNATTASANSEFDYDSVDLLGGDQVDLGKRVNLHLFAGLRYASIDSKMTALYQAPNGSTAGLSDNDIGPLGDSISLSSDFDGIGPRLGIDANINVVKGLSVTTSLAGSLLMGKNDGNYTWVDRDKANTRIDTTLDSADRVVPELDAKLGAQYLIPVAQDSAFVIGAGYKVENYFDAVEYPNATIGQTTASNFAINGPYLDLTFRA